MTVDKQLRKAEEKLKKQQERLRKAQAKAAEKTRIKMARIGRKQRRNAGGNRMGSGAAEFSEGFMQTLKALMEYSREQIEHNLRLQLIVSFAVCFVVALIVFQSSLQNFSRLDDRKYIDYDEPAKTKQEKLLTLIESLGDEDLAQGGENLESAISDDVDSFSDTARYYVLDNLGSVQASNDPNAPTAFDFHTLVQQLQDNAAADMASGRYTQLLSIKGDENLWLLIEDQLQGVVKYRKAGNVAVFIAILQATSVFILMFYLITKQKIGYIQRISDGIGMIARGNLKHRVPESGKDELYRLASSINHMSRSLEAQIEAEREAERSKQELITNVSHDLRTPLTSVLGYLKLVIDKRYETPEQMEEYLQTVYHKSEKLKDLIDDLFEYTKLTYGSAPLERVRVSMNELMEQMLEEYLPVLEESRLDVDRVIPEEDLYCLVDPQKLHRVVENLLSNAVKYSDKPGIVRVRLERTAEGISLRLENPAAGLEEAELERLFERFYRLEGSRSMDTGGSGLGLAIARGIVEAHGGTLRAEYREGWIGFIILLPCDTTAQCNE